MLTPRFFGNPLHLTCIKNELVKQFKGRDDVGLLVPETTAGFKSFDGIELCARRVLSELEQYLEKQRKKRRRVTKISITGYSMGGLIGRYLIGMLEEEQFFDHVEPVQFTTFATPHVGSYFHAKSIRASLLNFFGTNVLGVSGNDLFANSTVLEEMSDLDSRYITGLKRFKYRTLFANAVYDRTVPFYTAYICEKDPFQQLGHLDLSYYDAPDSGTGFSEPFFVDMSRSVYVGETSKEQGHPDPTERQIRVMMTVALPIMFPLLLTVTSFTTLMSHYRVRQAKRLVALESKRPLLSLTASRSRSSSTSEDSSAEQQDETMLSPSEEIAQFTGDMVDDMLAPGEQPGGDEQLADVHTSHIPAEPAGSNGYEGLIDSTPTELELNDKIHGMIKRLNTIEWEKYTVKLHRAHSHAEIVNRRNKPGEGEALVKFWVRTMAKRVGPARTSAKSSAVTSRPTSQHTVPSEVLTA